ncbi:hypothetical protein CapIbe_016860, partial [Capra ibex]
YAPTSHPHLAFASLSISLHTHTHTHTHARTHTLSHPLFSLPAISAPFLCGPALPEAGKAHSGNRRAAIRRRPREGQARSCPRPGFLQPWKTRGGRRGPERGRQRRHAGVQLQAKPSASAGPFTRRGTQSCGRRICFSAESTPGRRLEDRRGCKPFEVHQHGEVLLYFRSPRFIPGRGSGRLRRLLSPLGLPRLTRGRWDPGLPDEAGREPGRAGQDRWLRACRPFRRPLPPPPPPRVTSPEMTRLPKPVTLELFPPSSLFVSKS